MTDDNAIEAGRREMEMSAFQHEPETLPDLTVGRIPHPADKTAAAVQLDRIKALVADLRQSAQSLNCSVKQATGGDRGSTHSRDIEHAMAKEVAGFLPALSLLLTQAEKSAGQIRDAAQLLRKTF